MNVTQRAQSARTLPRGISRTNRAALLVVGLASWSAGGVASFLAPNGAGATSLVAVGAACSILALIGRWPSRISMSGNEVSWDEVRETVDAQIDVVKASGETDDGVVAELTSLRERLDVLQRTGTVPEHPAALYDGAIAAAISRVLPGAEVIEQETRSRDLPDFLIRYHNTQVYVETKWRSDPSRPLAGSTLPGLLNTLPHNAKLLVVVNSTRAPTGGAAEILKQAIGRRGDIVAWQDIRDDAELGRALTSLLDLESSTFEDPVT
jgi:hypothetical protein